MSLVIAKATKDTSQSARADCNDDCSLSCFVSDHSAQILVRPEPRHDFPESRAAGTLWKVAPTMEKAKGEKAQREWERQATTMQKGLTGEIWKEFEEMTT